MSESPDVTSGLCNSFGMLATEMLSLPKHPFSCSDLFKRGTARTLYIADQRGHFLSA